MRAKSAATLIAMILCGVPSAYSATPPTPAVTVAPSRITASGITPGGEVLFFGAGLEPKRYFAVPHRWSKVIADTGLKGTVSYDLDTAVTWNAIWIVADLSSGRCVVASTAGFDAERTYLTQRTFSRGLLGAVNQFTYHRPVADFLYVVPGGAWTLLARDGDTSDADGKQDGITTIDLSRLQRVGDGTSLPAAFAPGGALFIIDSSRLDLLELKIDASLLAGVR